MVLEGGREDGREREEGKEVITQLEVTSQVSQGTCDGSL